MPEKARFYVIQPKRLAEKRVVLQVNLPYR